MFLGVADCVICPATDQTFNEYLAYKNMPTNKWNHMPEVHFLCGPAVFAQAWKLNLVVIWKKKGHVNFFALPYGELTSLIIPILVSANSTTSDTEGLSVIKYGCTFGYRI
jgi:hypothetical protein